jgi:hypothetical protein
VAEGLRPTRLIEQVHTKERIMKRLLTSSGISNPSIHQALADLLEQ